LAIALNRATLSLVAGRGLFSTSFISRISVAISFGPTTERILATEIQELKEDDDDRFV
jgi:hypothetical protein